MTPDGSYIVIHLIEPKKQGEQFQRTRLGWPLHITFVPWYTCLDEAKMTGALKELAQQTQRFTVTIGEEALFGPDRDVLVSLVATIQPCQVLHRALVDVLRNQKVTFTSERFMGAQFRPHVTHHGTRRRLLGDVESVDNLTLVRLADQQTCEVIRHFKFGAVNEAAA